MYRVINRIYVCIIYHSFIYYHSNQDRMSELLNPKPENLKEYRLFFCCCRGKSVLLLKGCFDLFNLLLTHPFVGWFVGYDLGKPAKSPRRTEWTRSMSGPSLQNRSSPVIVTDVPQPFEST